MTPTPPRPRCATAPRTRAAALLAVIAVAAVIASGCSGDRPAVPAASTAATSGLPSAADPAVCADVRKVNNDASTRFTANISEAVQAGEQGDTARQLAAMDRLRQSFRDWSAALRAQAGAARDPRVQAVLEQYAGAVDAAIARVRSPADLESLTTFDDQELDVVASKLQDVCH